LWTDKNRARYDRDHLRYPSDLTDDEWVCVEPLIPPARRGGGKRRVDMRAVMNGVMYILSTGCQWRYIPKDFPPRSTLHDYFTWWHCDGTLDRIHHALYVECREKAEREASPCIWLPQFLCGCKWLLPPAGKSCLDPCPQGRQPLHRAADTGPGFDVWAGSAARSDSACGCAIEAMRGAG
jgi:transposase